MTIKLPLSQNVKAFFRLRKEVIKMNLIATKYRVQKRGKTCSGQKILIFGYGRSGSTLLATSLCHENSHYDLGEYLRARKYVRHQLFWFSNPLQLIESRAEQLLGTAFSRVVVHVKPYHLDYFGYNFKEFLNKMSSAGWCIIFLYRNPVEIMRSEHMARARNQWSIRSGEIRKVRDFLPKDLTWTINEIKKMVEHNQQSLVLARTMKNTHILDYEIDLETPAQQNHTSQSLLEKLDISCNFKNTILQKGGGDSMSNRDKRLLQELYNLYDEITVNSEKTAS